MLTTQTRPQTQTARHILGSLLQRWSSRLVSAEAGAELPDSLAGVDVLDSTWEDWAEAAGQVERALA